MSARAYPELELQSRYVLLASLAEDRRVLDIGGDLRSLLTLAEAGPAELTACSERPDTLAAELAGAEVEGIEVTATPRLPLVFDADAFDLIVCHDLGDLILTEERWIAELRRVLSPDGYLALALANPNGARLGDLSGQVLSSRLTYEEAFEKLSGSFGTLTVLVQSPLVGNLFYDLESTEEEPDLAFDRSLLEDEVDEAGWYVLVFGPDPVHRDDLTIVQVPFSHLANAVASRGAEAQLRATGTEPAISNAALTALEEAKAQLERDKSALSERVAELEARPTPAAGASPLEKAELDWLKQRVRELEEQTGAELLTMLRERIKQLKLGRRRDQEKLNTVRERLLSVQAAHDDAQRLLPLMRERIKQLKLGQRVEREKLNEVRRRLLAIETEHAEAARALPLLHERIDQLKQQRRADRDKLNQARQERLAAETRLEAAVAELGSARANIESGKGLEGVRVTELEDEVAALTAERDAAATELGLLRQRITSLKTGRADAEAKLATLRAQALKRDASAGVADAEATMLRERIKQLKLERRREQEKLHKVRERLLRIESVHDAIAAEHQLLVRRVDSLKQERRADKDKLASLREKLLGLQAERDTAVAELQLLRERVGALEADREAERNQAAQVREKLQTDTQELQAAAGELPLLRERLRSLLESRAGEQAKTQKLRQRVMELESRAVDPDALEAQLDEERRRAASAAERVSELEQELARHVQDKRSFETQIQDLLEEVSQLRASADASGDTGEALREEKVAAEALREELVRMRGKMSNVEAENQGLAREVQRLTDALHESELSRTPAPSVHEAETVVAGSPLADEKPEEPKTPREAAQGTTRDAVGRPIESSLEDIEDLIADSVPPPPTRR